jgi:hypothetical protein
MDRKLFTSILSKRLYPLLRAEGFRGSGTTLRRVHEPVVEVFNVQASAGGDRCYLNLGVHLTFLPSAGGQLIEPGAVNEPNCVFRTRITPPAGQPGWHYGSNESEAESNVGRILEAWEREAKPFFASHSYPGGVSRLLDELSPPNVHSAHLLTFARVALQLGRREQAAHIAGSALERVPPSATGLRSEIAQFMHQAGEA